MRNLLLLLSSLLLLGLTGCGGASGDAASAESTPTATTGLSAAELEHGVGPISNVALTDAIDAALAAKGEDVFTMKCSACHKLDARYVGPPLGDVLSTRSPAYVMNMMLNPAEMLQKHPEAKAMLAQFAVPMPDQNLTEDDARAVLEYLRAHQ